MKYEVGMVVELNSGGPQMTVTRKDAVEGYLTVCWIDEREEPRCMNGIDPACVHVIGVPVMQYSPVQLHEEIRVIYAVDGYVASFYDNDGDVLIAKAKGNTVQEALANLQNKEQFKNWK